VANRSYEESCAAAHALDLVGERWALLVVRELLFGPKRFTDLKAGLPAISPNVLTQRLSELEASGVVRRRKLPPPASVWVYELTEWGLELEDVIKALGRWGVHSPLHRKDAYMGTDALMLSFRTMFDAELAQDLDAVVELRVNGDAFRATIADQEMELVRGNAEAADVIIDGDVPAIASVVYGGRKLTEAIRAGELKVEGDRAVARHFVELFPLPERE
jgi:DNA-binding HxlR family transcriptional regulator/putative sterol carrier protein